MGIAADLGVDRYCLGVRPGLVLFLRCSRTGSENGPKEGRWAMMNDMMGGGMMWGMGVGGIVGLIVIALVIAALIKYLFFR
jgi:hypothetical protein